ncbi:MAG: NYN domain-containing protein [Rhodothalassiaceae bacterium]
MPDRIWKVAIMIDGGFLLKRLPHIVPERFHSSPEAVARTTRTLCQRHIEKLAGVDRRWLDHVYRIFYYDAAPFGGKAHHPLLNKQIDFSKTKEAKFREELFEHLRRTRKFALRLGKVSKEGDWAIRNTTLARQLLGTRDRINSLPSETLSETSQPLVLSEKTRSEGIRLQKLWSEVKDDHVGLGLRQKGVDMRIGLDIASITLKKQADTIILVSGDSNFVPAAKLARREGVDFVLDPLWQKINPDLFEHIDGLRTVLRRDDEALALEAETE